MRTKGIQKTESISNPNKSEWRVRIAIHVTYDTREVVQRCAGREGAQGGQTSADGHPMPPPPASVDWDGSAISGVGTVGPGCIARL